MQTQTLGLNIFDQMKYIAFDWRDSLSFSKKLALALAVACLTGLSAQISFHLAGTPVPITMQTFAVLLSAILLGKNWGGISQVIYAGLGFMGIPWFAGFSGGPSFLFGPTMGYIVGFIVAAFFIGYIIDEYIKKRSFIKLLGLMFFANFIIIYGIGLLWLYFWTKSISGHSLSFYSLYLMGAFPFLIGDMIKIFAVSIVSKSIALNSRF